MYVHVHMQVLHRGSKKGLVPLWLSVLSNSGGLLVVLANSRFLA